MKNQADKEAKKLLQMLVKFLNKQVKNTKKNPFAAFKQQQAAQNLWNILTILRGPDSDDGHVKTLTTARVRSLIGLDDVTGVGFVINGVPLTPQQISQRRDTNYHFNRHYHQAVEAVQALFDYDLNSETKVPR